jgi:hypothetical protein
MGDERVTDVLRESQSAILKRFCPVDVQAAIAPVNVRKREMSDLLAAQAETKAETARALDLGRAASNSSDTPRRVAVLRSPTAAVTTIVSPGAKQAIKSQTAAESPDCGSERNGRIYEERDVREPGVPFSKPLP